jgi:hypothetical protein
MNGISAKQEKYGENNQVKNSFSYFPNAVFPASTTIAVFKEKLQRKQWPLL